MAIEFSDSTLVKSYSTGKLNIKAYKLNDYAIKVYNKNDNNDTNNEK